LNWPFYVFRLIWISYNHECHQTHKQSNIFLNINHKPPLKPNSQPWLISPFHFTLFSHRPKSSHLWLFHLKKINSIFKRSTLWLCWNNFRMNGESLAITTKPTRSFLLFISLPLLFTRYYVYVVNCEPFLLPFLLADLKNLPSKRIYLTFTTERGKRAKWWDNAAYILEKRNYTKKKSFSLSIYQKWRQQK